MTTPDGVKFQSKREAMRWMVLKSLEERGLISMLRRQVKFPLDVNGVHIANYYADFCYLDEHCRYTVEDAKPPGMITTEASIKLALVRAIHGIRVKLV